MPSISLNLDLKRHRKENNMTHEEKDLLLKDLCARLPYGVKCQIKGDDTNTPRKLIRIEVDELDGVLLDFWTEKPVESLQVYLSEVKPYLRPMSSMTDAEGEEYRHLLQDIWDKLKDWKCANLIDWLNSHHFDYRRLIEKGLAIEAPSGMYK